MMTAKEFATIKSKYISNLSTVIHNGETCIINELT